MKTKTIKALAKINILLDEEQQKFYDKQKNLELSHNRKCKLLEKIETFLKIARKEIELDEFGKAMIDDLLFKINNELTFYGRVRY